MTNTGWAWGQEIRSDAYKARCILGLAVCVMFLFSAELGGSIYINYSKEVETTELLAYDTSIVSPEARVDLAALKSEGHECLAYLSVLEMASDATYRGEATAAGLRALATNEVWQSWVMDISSPLWREFVLSKLAARAANFDGFFLDTVDSVEVLEQKFPARANEFRRGFIELVRALKGRHPGKKIVLNRGFRFWKELRPEIDGVLIESVFQTVNPRTMEYSAMAAEGRDWLLGQAREIRASGLGVYVVDYVDPAKRELADETARRIAAEGFVGLITTPRLDGEILAPIRERSRRVLAIYGNQEEDVQNLIRWPVDSIVARFIQMPLEWLGYEVDYINPSFEALPKPASQRHAAVILDRFLRVPQETEAALAEWLIRRKRAGCKIIFLGGIPFLDVAVRKRVMAEFELEGTGERLSKPGLLKFSVLGPAMNYEAKAQLVSSPLLDVRAPKAVEVLAAVGEQAANGRRSDAVFVTQWGGAALDPYVFFRRPDFVELWMVDPFYFLERVLKPGDLPVMDATTRDGVRIFFSHIDGDGLRHQSSVESGKRSGEIILERVIGKYPFPFTCSVIEAEIRGLVADQALGDAERMTALARRIFELEQVEAASHTYTHPFYWMANDRDVMHYEAQRLELKPEADPGKLDYRREVEGSIRFIEENLLPPGKKVSIYLWSGNCRPPAEAIEWVDRMGIENMNGGETMISRKYPSLSRVSARCIPREGRLQIFTAHQNENVYRERWQAGSHSNDPFFGGFIHALEGFKRTEAPRRLKPVNIYFHWYSGDNVASLRALTVLFDWAQGEELHALKASEYSRLVRDCRAARIFEMGEGGWVVVKGSAARTLRLPSGRKRPDLKASEGVTGYREGPDGLYVHTDESKRVKLVMREGENESHLYLVSSTAPISIRNRTASGMEFQVKDTRPGVVKLGGYAAGWRAEVNINSRVSIVEFDSGGTLRLELPARADVTVRVGDGIGGRGAN